MNNQELSECEEVRKCESCNVEKDIEEFFTEKEYIHCEECRALLNKQKKEERKKKDSDLLKDLDILIDGLKNKMNAQQLNNNQKMKLAKFIAKNL